MILVPDGVCRFKSGQLYNDTKELIVIETEERGNDTFIAIRGFMSKKR